MTGRRRASFGLARRFPLRGPGEMLLAGDAARAVQSGERDGAPVGVHLDDHAPGARVHADLRVRPPAAQASDQTCLIGGELEILRHAITIGMNAELLTKIRSGAVKD